MKICRTVIQSSPLENVAVVCLHVYVVLLKSADYTTLDSRVSDVSCQYCDRN